MYKITYRRMSSFWEFICNYCYSIYKQIQGKWPINALRGPHLKPASEETTTVLKKILQILIKEVSATSDDVCSLLDSLPDQEDLLQVVDDIQGYDILQLAVIRGWKDVVYLLLKKQCSPDGYRCSPPVHLAAFTGRADILKLLLSSGAGNNSSCGMCFPQYHLALSYKTSLLGFNKYPVFRCHSNSLSPVKCAVIENKAECLDVLLESLPDKIKAKGNFLPTLLHYACLNGATSCIEYFVKRYPGYVDWFNDEGETPLLSAVPWGRESVTILVDSGADVRIVSKKLHETALHRLYRRNIDGLFSIFDTTKYLLTTGIEQQINAYTTLGETPLHMIISHVSYTGGHFADPNQRKVARSHLQEDYQQQVLDTMKLLMEFNADHTLLNAYGLQPLSRMLHIALKACNVDNPCPCVQTSIFTYLIKDYKNDYSALCQAMEVLLSHGANPNFQCQLGHSPVVILLLCLIYDDVYCLCEQSMHVVQAFETLLKHGATLNFVTGNQGTCATLLAMMCKRYFSINLEEDEEEEGSLLSHGGSFKTNIKMKFAELANEVVTKFLQYGLNANHTSSKTCQYPKGGKGNALIDFVKLTEFCQSSKDLNVIHLWLRTLLQWGANPNISPYPSEPIICHCQSSIFLKKQDTQAMSHYIHDIKERDSFFKDGWAGEMLMLFYNSMDHQTLFECLSAAKTSAQIYHGDSGSMDILDLINELSENPRSLKQIARVAIYQSIERNCSRVHSLPIPDSLKRYLCFE
ncbi:uncharacterized protein LOC121369901 [Gigantopelta aegis]|uniref:uncharacterized protein LOC121369901 n=1 Tax=Gigantopelta aegis TaxID=1735272 RepID=UPI001B88A85C|nr:uncharacterized protein LOC121369901 [Gigantopelta aegis]